MSYKKKAYESSLKAHKKLIATKLLDGIEKLYENKASERRWIWELLQNAKDVADSSVKIQIVLQNDSVEFKHNGNPFVMDNITYLIEQVSTKDRAKSAEEVLDTTGKFGTGFMTTHLLSKKVDVKGILKDEEDDIIYKRFNLLLDRDAKTPEEMIAKVDKSYQVFEELDDENLCPILTSYKANKDFDTSFKYQLDPQSLAIAKTGIDDLHNALSYTLIFISKIESVVIIDEINNKKTVYSRGQDEHFGIIKISTINIQSDEELEVLKIASISNTKNTICLAIPVKNLENSWAIEKIKPNTPILFCDFPLIGSEKFTFPTIINSPIFNPTEPRDGVLLDDRDDEKRLFNKEIFEQSVVLYQQLLEYASFHWKNAHLLANSGIPQDIDQNWYKSNVQKIIRQSILETPIVDLQNGTRISLKSALIPYHRSQAKVSQIWELTLVFGLNKLPIYDHIIDWYNFIDADWKKDLGVNLRYSLDNLIQNISSQENLQKLSQLIDKNELETLNWLNQVIKFIFDDKSTDLLDNYPIIPNQYGNFKLFKELFKDDHLPEELKYILKILGKDWKNSLAHLQITCDFSQQLNINQVSDQIDKIIRENQNKEIRKAVYYLISCFPAKKSLNQQAITLRSQIWQLAKDLDQSVPEQRTISRCTNKLWDECDQWLLKTLVTDLVGLKNIENLKVRLNKNTNQETVCWLSNFIQFLNTDSNWQIFYSEKAILPNQEGVFKGKLEVSFDQDIPEEIKDILKLLGINYRAKLLDREIKGFNNLNKLSVSDASDDINKIIRSKTPTPNINLKSAVYSLISYFVDENDSDRLKIWSLAKKMYGEAVPSEITILPALKEFIWDDCNDWILKLMSDDVSSQIKLETLSKTLSLNLVDTIQYLDELVFFTCNNFPDLSASIKEKKIWPNQIGEFCQKKFLKKDGGIPQELKEIADCLTTKVWSHELLLKDDHFIQVPQLFDKTETETIENIAKEIDDALQAYKGDRKDYNFVHPVKLLLSWSASQDKNYVKQFLPYFSEHKARLLLDILGDDRINENIFELIQTDPDKLTALTKLASNSNISENDLNEFLANYTDFRKLTELKQQIATPGSASDVISLLEELGIDQESLRQVLNYRTDNQPEISTSSCNRQRSYASVINFDDLNFEEINDQPNIGELGEQFVYDKLVRKFGTQRVQWMNQETEGKFPYDFKVLEENLEKVLYYIDAKSTKNAEYQSESTLFSITNAQWEFMKECDNYYIARVFRAISDRPNLKLLNIKLDEDLLRN
jgi:hypothetical protein